MAYEKEDYIKECRDFEDAHGRLAFIWAGKKYYRNLGGRVTKK